MASRGQILVDYRAQGFRVIVTRSITWCSSTKPSRYTKHMARTLVRRVGRDGEAIGLIGVLLARHASGNRLTDLLPHLDHLLDTYGPDSADFLALTAARAGDIALARRVHARHPYPPIRPDFLRLLRSTVRAALAVALGETDQAAQTYRSLLP